MNTNTDNEWKKWGDRDPYFGVVTDPKFRSSNLNEEAIREFFETGEKTVDHIIAKVRKLIRPDFNPGLCLDFGCGTGRLAIALAKKFHHVVGVDISESMLAEARKNCDIMGISNLELHPSDDQLSAIASRKFDFINTYIVLQHISIKQVEMIIPQLLGMLNEDGIAALHMTYGDESFAGNHGVPEKSLRASLRKTYRYFRHLAKNIVYPHKDPRIEMNTHNLNKIFYMIQNSGSDMIHCELTKHGLSHGLMMYFTNRPSGDCSL